MSKSPEYISQASPQVLTRLVHTCSGELIDCALSIRDILFVVFQAEERGSSAKVSVFMEHFSLEHQVTERISSYNEFTKTKTGWLTGFWLMNCDWTGFFLWVKVLENILRTCWTDSRLVRSKRRTCRNNMTGDQQKINLLWKATLSKAWRWRVFIGSLFSTPTPGKETLQDSQAEGWLCAKEVHIYF